MGLLPGENNVDFGMREKCFGPAIEGRVEDSVLGQTFLAHGIGQKAWGEAFKINLRGESAPEEEVGRASHGEPNGEPPPGVKVGPPGVEVGAQGEQCENLAKQVEEFGSGAPVNHTARVTRRGRPR